VSLWVFPAPTLCGSVTRRGSRLFLVTGKYYYRFYSRIVLRMDITLRNLCVVVARMLRSGVQKLLLIVIWGMESPFDFLNYCQNFCLNVFVLRNKNSWFNFWICNRRNFKKELPSGYEIRVFWCIKKKIGYEDMIYVWKLYCNIKGYWLSTRRNTEWMAELFWKKHWRGKIVVILILLIWMSVRRLVNVFHCCHDFV
jgi:hypothetical protein